ncbi:MULTISPECIES: hypothetical protein [Streptomyces]|uniref:hypothetical protein n=1 Tax=Streptomyces TaxID=1883 RepID=UPI000AA1C64C|nr:MULTISPECIES: hypothetical protein [Streptomyces]
MREAAEQEVGRADFLLRALPDPGGSLPMTTAAHEDGAARASRLRERADAPAPFMAR